MTKQPWTRDEYRTFDRLSLQACDRNQLKRIEGRMALQRFIEAHGKEKCDAMFAEIKRREAKRKGSAS